MPAPKSSTHRVLKFLLKVLGYTSAVLIMGIFLLYLVVLVFFGSVQDDSNQKRHLMGQLYDLQAFPTLSESTFFYQRIHVGDHGAWVMVYPLDAETHRQFMQRWQVQHAPDLAQANALKSLECITPTIKKRWKSWHSNIHYVQPPAWTQDHQDYKVHDSFIVYGSDRHLSAVEQACRKGFYVFNDDKNNEHQYWAIPAQQHLLFSVYRID